MKWIDAKRTQPKDEEIVITYYVGRNINEKKIILSFYNFYKEWVSMLPDGTIEYDLDIRGWIPLPEFDDFASQEDFSVDCEGWIRPGDCIPEEGQNVVIRWPDGYAKREDVGCYHLGRWWGNNAMEIPKECVTGWIPVPERDKFVCIEDEEATDSGNAGASGEAVNHPAHYKAGDYECIEVMLAVKGLEKVKNWCECNSFKYNWRNNKKGGIEDMEKARWYIDKFLELSRLIEGGK